jgi:hypothetical protein
MPPHPDLQIPRRSSHRYDSGRVIALHRACVSVEPGLHVLRVDRLREPMAGARPESCVDEHLVRRRAEEHDGEIGILLPAGLDYLDAVQTGKHEVYDRTNPLTRDDQSCTDVAVGGRHHLEIAGCRMASSIKKVSVAVSSTRRMAGRVPGVSLTRLLPLQELAMYGRRGSAPVRGRLRYRP